MLAQIDTTTGYISNIDHIKQIEYSQLKDTTYVDHAGTTLYARSLIEACANDLKSSVYGNPHSESDASRRTTECIKKARQKLLSYLHASPEHFDVVFVANATAGVKLVAEAFRDHSPWFDYAYHRDCHTSVVGVRQLAGRSCRLTTEKELQQWLTHRPRSMWRRHGPRLFAFPGQSNLTGFRPSLSMCQQVTKARTSTNNVYCLLDAAALLSTSDLNLSDVDNASDFTVLSCYKIFGYPDLGAIIVKRSSSHILLRKKYFGGGTVDMLTTDKPWHIKKTTLHEALEEGTLPFHNIIALGHALDVHSTLYGSPFNVSRHARYVAEQARSRLRHLQHHDGSAACRLYGDNGVQDGPVVAFNLLDTHGRYFRNYVVEHFAIANGIALRVGGMCNPGGIQENLDISFRDMKMNFDAGVRCGDDRELPEGFNGAIGMVRISFGAISSLGDVETFMEFVKKTFLDREHGDKFFDAALEVHEDEARTDVCDSDHCEMIGRKDESMKTREKQVRIGKWYERRRSDSRVRIPLCF